MHGKVVELSETVARRRRFFYIFVSRIDFNTDFCVFWRHVLKIGETGIGENETESRNIGENARQSPLL